jgi:hypothetical protein
VWLTRRLQNAALVAALEDALRGHKAAAAAASAADGAATDTSYADDDAPVAMSSALKAALAKHGNASPPLSTISASQAEALLIALRAEMATPAQASAAPGSEAPGGPQGPASAAAAVSAEALAVKSVKELKAAAAAQGLDTAGCTEKGDLVALLLQGKQKASSNLRPGGEAADSLRPASEDDKAPLLAPKAAAGAAPTAQLAAGAAASLPAPEEDIGDID